MPESEKTYQLNTAYVKALEDSTIKYEYLKPAYAQLRLITELQSKENALLLKQITSKDLQIDLTTKEHKKQVKRINSTSFYKGAAAALLLQTLLRIAF